jgi:hypothetical protein
MRRYDTVDPSGSVWMLQKKILVYHGFYKNKNKNILYNK